MSDTTTKPPKPGPVRTTEGYGLEHAPADGSELPWSRVVEWVSVARNYWVCTVRKDGRPHAIPVWGLWMDDTIWFSTDPSSVKGRNLIERPDVVVHLESGDEVCIFEGRAEQISDAERLGRFDDLYDQKYDVRPSSMGESSGVFALRPSSALAWTEADFPKTATRFAF